MVFYLFQMILFFSVPINDGECLQVYNDNIFLNFITWPQPVQRGILPDVMHLVHLAIGPDVLVSLLLDWTDGNTYVQGNTRDKRLEVLFENYRQYCEENKIGDRAARKLFTTQTLSPDSASYTEVSQKRLNATACRYMFFWACGIAMDYAVDPGTDADV